MQETVEPARGHLNKECNKAWPVSLLKETSIKPLDTVASCRRTRSRKTDRAPLKCTVPLLRRYKWLSNRETAPGLCRCKVLSDSPTKLAHLYTAPINIRRRGCCLPAEWPLSRVAIKLTLHPFPPPPLFLSVSFYILHGDGASRWSCFLLARRTETSTFPDTGELDNYDPECRGSNCYCSGIQILGGLLETFDIVRFQ